MGFGQLADTLSTWPKDRSFAEGPILTKLMSTFSHRKMQQNNYHGNMASAARRQIIGGGSNRSITGPARINRVTSSARNRQRTQVMLKRIRVR